MAAIASFSVARENEQCQQTHRPRKPISVFKGILWKKIKSKKKLVARWRPFWLSVESWKSNQVIRIFFNLWPWPLTLGKQNCREGLNVCVNYESNLLHHVGVVAKRLRAAAAETAAHEGDDNTPSGPTGRGVKTNKSEPLNQRAGGDLSLRRMIISNRMM